jgi:hypothetical protein
MKIRLLAVVWLAISFAVPASVAQDAMKLIKADEIVWQEHPIFKGVQVVWMIGDPTKVELIVQRTKIPPALQDSSTHSSLCRTRDRAYWHLLERHV